MMTKKNPTDKDQHLRAFGQIQQQIDKHHLNKVI